jgi:hypothetical protein
MLSTMVVAFVIYNTPVQSIREPEPEERKPNPKDLS